MILAEKIMNERKKLGMSQEELAEQLEVSRQSVSKWESAQSTPDLNRILKMAELFQVSTDYLLKDEMEEESYQQEENLTFHNEVLRSVSMEEATDYLQVIQTVRGKVAFGVSLCVMAATPLMLSLGCSAMGLISEDQAAGLGVSLLLVLVAIAVGLFVLNGRYTKPYDFLEKENIETAYGVDGMVKERRKNTESKRMVKNVVGVVLCIVSAVPLMVSTLWDANTNDASVLFGVGVLLILVALGVFFLVDASIESNAYKKLLQEEEYTPAGKRFTKKKDKVGAIYWSVATVIYLAWSFITFRWDMTWIVWPIAGVLYGLVTKILSLLFKEDSIA